MRAAHGPGDEFTGPSPCRTRTLLGLGMGALAPLASIRSMMERAKKPRSAMTCGAQSSARTANGVIRTPFLPPAGCRWARTMEGSIG
jgi:hypothetical protein